MDKRDTTVKILTVSNVLEYWGYKGSNNMDVYDIQKTL